MNTHWVVQLPCSLLVAKRVSEVFEENLKQRILQRGYHWKCWWPLHWCWSTNERAMMVILVMMTMNDNDDDDNDGWWWWQEVLTWSWGKADRQKEERRVKGRFAPPTLLSLSSLLSSLIYIVMMQTVIMIWVRQRTVLLLLVEVVFNIIVVDHHCYPNHHCHHNYYQKVRCLSTPSTYPLRALSKHRNNDLDLAVYICRWCLYWKATRM